MNIASNIQNNFIQLKQQNKYKEIARLIVQAFRKNTSQSNKEIFGYIPRIFREISINKNPELINTNDIYIGEPVVYKIFFPGNQKLYGIPYFYIFCYIKEESKSLNVYFQSADSRDKQLDTGDYKIQTEKVNFEGMISCFEDNQTSGISISDPGHFFFGRASSYYAGSEEINFPKLIANIVENITKAAGIALKDVFLFGSSAGSVGALLSSTYFNEKVNLLSVNSQIFTYKNKPLMEMAFGLSNSNDIIEKFGDQVSCMHRFQQDLNSVPNIYILAN